MTRTHASQVASLTAGVDAGRDDGLVIEMTKKNRLLACLTDRLKSEIDVVRRDADARCGELSRKHRLEVARMDNRVLEVEAEGSELRQKLAEVLGREVVAKSDVVTVTSETNETLNSDRKASKKIVEDLERRKGESDRTIGDLTRQLKESQNLIKSFEDTKKSNEKAIRSKLPMIDCSIVTDLTSDILEATFKQFTSEKAASEQKILSLTKENKFSKRELHHLSKEKTQLVSQEAEAIRQKSILEKKLFSLEANMKEAEELITELKQNTSETPNNVNSSDNPRFFCTLGIQTDMTNLKLNHEASKVDSEREESTKRLQKLSSQKMAAEQEISDLRRENSRLTDSEITLRQDNRELEFKIVNLDGNLIEAEEQSRNLRSQLNKLKDVQQASITLEKARQVEISTRKLMIPVMIQTDESAQDLNSILNQEVAAKQEMSLKYEVLQSSFSHLKENCDKLRADNTRMANILEDNETKTKDLESDRDKLGPLHIQLIEKAKENDILQLKINDLGLNNKQLSTFESMLQSELSQKSKELLRMSELLGKFKTQARAKLGLAIERSVQSQVQKMNIRFNHMQGKTDKLMSLVLQCGKALNSLLFQLREKLEDKAPLLHGGLDFRAYYELQQEKKDLMAILQKIEAKGQATDKELAELKSKPAESKLPAYQLLKEDNENLREQMQVIVTSMLETTEENKRLEQLAEDLEYQLNTKKLQPSPQAISKANVKATLSEHSKIFDDIQNLLAKVSTADQHEGIWQNDAEALVGKRLVLEARLEAKRYKGRIAIISHRWHSREKQYGARFKNRRVDEV